MQLNCTFNKMTMGYFKIVVMIYSIFESARDSRFEKYLGQYQIRFLSRERSRTL